MGNNASLENLKRSLALHSTSQIKELDDQIGVIKRLQASKGLLKSSASIKMVSEACISFFEQKQKIFHKSILDLPFEMNKDLNQKLVDVFGTYFTVDLIKLTSGS